ncbi:hypothetical protein Q9Q94_09505 [Uliginosibacterium sp. 31-16]|uniref:hypothetical protein n=1 Tax=Uliginosibacterium sp. 31-16 TaxID=3068315 RepID=UPI00273E0A67|nr:hypothetical protein [Uliginosibacterium sp. 31-16]MDP5239767.1 hypothetical protein [Uliginosibacterium sp. 31-16]
MKKLMRCLGALGLGVAVLMAVPAQGATKKKAVKSTEATTKPAKKATKAPARKAAASRKSTASTGQQCRVQKLKGGKTRRVCKGAAADPLLTSPIQGNALNKPAPADRSPEIKARSAPDRAYAVDGETFFFQGRKYRVAGLEGADNSDMATQRLQKALESGSLSIDPQSTDDAGVSSALVRINGRNLADQLH